METSRLYCAGMFESLLALGIVSAVTCGDVSAAPATFNVDGAVAVKQVWTADGLQRAFSSQTQVLNYKLKGIRHSAHVVSLDTIVEAAQPQANGHVKNAVLQGTVTVTGHDGYTVVFSMGELMANFGHEPVWIALDQDGKPLPDDDGPVELIVPGDIKAARWVHGVTSIIVSLPQ